MFALIVECISHLWKKSEFSKQLRTATGQQEVAAGSGTTHDEAMLEWARGLTLFLFLVLIALVISIAGK